MSRTLCGVASTKSVAYAIILACCIMPMICVASPQSLVSGASPVNVRLNGWTDAEISKLRSYGMLNSRTVAMNDATRHVAASFASATHQRNGGVTTPKSARSTWTLGSLTLTPCPLATLSSYWCANVTVPMDHDGSVSDNIKIAIMILRSNGAVDSTTGQRRAIIHLEGGPGGLGHTSDDLGSVLSMFYGDTHDIILIDQRGVGWSCGLGCINTAAARLMNGFDLSESEYFDASVADYAEACTNEIATDDSQALLQSDECIVGSAETPGAQRARLLPFIGSKQFAQDIEVIRQAAGYGKMWVHGASYGSVVAQIYAAMYPNAIAGVILDSPVNATNPAYAYTNQLPIEAEKYVRRSMELCFATPACAADFAPHTLDTATAAIVAKFTGSEAWPKTITYRYVDFTGLLPSIRKTTVQLTMEAVEFLLFGTTNEKERTLFLHAAARLLTKGSWDEMIAIVTGQFSYVYDIPSQTAISVANIIPTGIGICPIITGKDLIGRFNAHSVGDDLNVVDRANQFYSAVDVKQYRKGFAGGLYVWVPAGATAFERSNDPLYSIATQNATWAPAPGMHPDYPIIVVSSSIELDIPVYEADILYQNYAKTGRAHRVVIKDGKHAIMRPATGGSLDAYMCAAYAIKDIISNPTKPSSRVDCTNHPTPLTRYWPHEYTTPSDAKSGIARTFRAMMMNPTVRGLYSPIIACPVSGYMVVDLITGLGGSTKLAVLMDDCSFYTDSLGRAASIVSTAGAWLELASSDVIYSGFDLDLFLGIRYKASSASLTATCCINAYYNSTSGAFTGSCIPCL